MTINELTILVRILDIANMDRTLLVQAEAVASEIYAQAGISVHWVHAASSSVASRVPFPEAYRVDVRLSMNTPENLKPGALASAFPFARDGVRVVLYYDRFKPLLSEHRNGAPKILGHVLAHEIGHVLIGTNSHSDRGLMRRYWSRDDFGEMAVKRAEIAAGDREWMYTTLTRSPVTFSGMEFTPSRPRSARPTIPAP